MPEISNELKRLKVKLKLFDQEGLNWVLSDLIDLIVSPADLSMYGTDKEKLLRELRFGYLIELKKLERKNSKQLKIFTDEVRQQDK